MFLKFTFKWTNGKNKFLSCTIRFEVHICTVDLWEYWIKSQIYNVDSNKLIQKEKKS